MEQRHVQLKDQWLTGFKPMQEWPVWPRGLQTDLWLLLIVECESEGDRERDIVIVFLCVWRTNPQIKSIKFWSSRTPSCEHEEERGRTTEIVKERKRKCEKGSEWVRVSERERERETSSPLLWTHLSKMVGVTTWRVLEVWGAEKHRLGSCGSVELEK